MKKNTKKIKVKKNSNVSIIKQAFFAIFLLIVVFTILYFNVLMKPSNTRPWEVGFEKLPNIEIENNLVTIKDFRDYKYANHKFLGANYIDRTVDINTLEKVWFVVEPFNGIPFIKFDGVAHTYFVFDFKDQEPIAISVEARREKNETFDLLSGMLNKFELMYVWGSETDLTGRRVLFEYNKLYMYPLTITNDSAKKLFLQLARSTESLETKPRFYNSITSNCTNELAKNANMVKKDTIPVSLIWLMPGYSGNELYRLGLIPHDKPFPEISKQYFASDIIKKYEGQKDAYKLVREELLK